MAGPVIPSWNNARDAAAPQSSPPVCTVWPVLNRHSNGSGIAANMATHVAAAVVENKQKINPIKASKRGGK